VEVAGTVVQLILPTKAGLYVNEPKVTDISLVPGFRPMDVLPLRAPPAVSALAIPAVARIPTARAAMKLRVIIFSLPL
jgi:hypothetical protein